MIKRFLKFVFKSTIIGIVSSIVSFFLVVLVVIGIMASLAGPKISLPSKAVLNVDLSMNLIDTPPTLTIEDILKQAVDDVAIPEYNLRDIVETIHRAKTDYRVKGLLLNGSFLPSNFGCSYPALQEIRSILEDFKSSGKPVIAYSVNPSLRDLYVMSVADEFYLNTSGAVELVGLYSEQMFFANAMAKYGIGVQAVRIGDYKSAVEPFTRTEMSKEAKESERQLLDEVWVQILGNLSSSRNIDPLVINNYIQRNPIMNAKAAVKLGLCDKAITHEELNKRLCEISSLNPDTGSFEEISLHEYIFEKDQFDRGPSHDGVAVVYAEGEIVGGYGEDNQAGADRIVTNLREARSNPSIKAIVLRVNSPGGGAAASKIIQDELVEVKKQGIPLVVSMGGYAASGGYLISESADHIFSHPHTITGSIGIFGLLFNFGEGAGKLGITFDEVKTNQNSDILSISKPKTPLQLQIIQGFLKDFYDEWLETVSGYRNKSVEDVSKIASGHVWSGYQANRLGLVDEIGGLYDAIDYAATQAGLAEYDVYDFPRKLNEEEALAKALGFNVRERLIKSPSLATKLENQIQETLKILDRFNDPMGAYALTPFRYR